jgi:hypothetical protein
MTSPALHFPLQSLMFQYPVTQPPIHAIYPFPRATLAEITSDNINDLSKIDLDMLMEICHSIFSSLCSQFVATR